MNLGFDMLIQSMVHEFFNRVGKAVKDIEVDGNKVVVSLASEEGAETLPSALMPLLSLLEDVYGSVEVVLHKPSENKDEDD